MPSASEGASRAAQAVDDGLDLRDREVPALVRVVLRNDDGGECAIRVRRHGTVWPMALLTRAMQAVENSPSAVWHQIANQRDSGQVRRAQS